MIGCEQFIFLICGVDVYGYSILVRRATMSKEGDEYNICEVSFH